MFENFHHTHLSSNHLFLNKTQNQDHTLVCENGSYQNCFFTCSFSLTTKHADDQSSDHSPLNETPLRTILQDVIIPASETPKLSKPKTFKKTTRRSQRMRKGSSSKPTTAHIDLVSDEEKEVESNDEMNEASEEEAISEKGRV